MITQGISLSAKQSFLLGHHQPEDKYMLALYSAAAAIGPETQTYTAEGEITGPGYKAGGIQLTGFRSGTAGRNAFLTFADIAIDRATFTSRGAMIYNASKNNAAICVLNFGADRPVFDGKFEIKFPNPTEKTALISLA